MAWTQKAQTRAAPPAHEPAREPPPPAPPWRALVIGLLLLPLLTKFGHLSYIIAQSAVWTAQALLRGPLVLLFLLVVWSLLWRKCSPRLARYLSLDRQELILIYVMMTVGTALAGECWAIHVVPGLAGTAAYQAAGAHPEWAGWLRETPRWFYVQDMDVVQAIHHGQSSLYRWENLRGLIVPVAVWAVLMIALAVFTQCLAQLLRRQWIHRERLSFPLVFLPMTLVATDGPSPWWRSKMFWAGVVLAGGIELINGLNHLYPNVPYLPVKVTQFPAAAAQPWSGFGPVWVAFYPWVIALGYMVPREVTFSLWFFFWFSRLQDFIATMMGLRESGGYAPAVAPYHLHQATGAFLVLGAMLLWRARREITEVARTAWAPGHRGTVICLLASVGTVLAWGWAARIPPYLAGAFLVVYGLFSIVVGRLAAESGGPSSFPPLSTHESIALMGGLNASHLAPQTVAAFGWWQNLGGQITDGLLPHQITGARLAEDVKADRWLHPVLAVGAVAGVFVGMWSLLELYFERGIMSAEVRGWPARTAPLAAFQFIHSSLTTPQDIPLAKLVAFLAGGAATAFMVWARESWVGWPLHPIGYAVAGNWGMQEVWCPFLVAWVIKSAVLHGGGVRLYRGLLPFFLGVLLGDFLTPMGWAVIGLISGEQMYLSYPH